MGPFVEAELVERFVETLEVEKGGDDWTSISLYELRERYRRFLVSKTTNSESDIKAIPISESTISNEPKPSLDIFSSFHSEGQSSSCK
jgi:hypothetical protein